MQVIVYLYVMSIMHNQKSAYGGELLDIINVVAYKTQYWVIENEPDRLKSSFYRAPSKENTFCFYN